MKSRKGKIIMDAMLDEEGMMKSRKGKIIMGLHESEKRILDMALDVVFQWSKIPKADIVGRRRFQALIDARHYWWMLCLRTGSFSLSRLGELVDRDHGSIIHAKGRHKNMLEVGQFIYPETGRDTRREPCGVRDYSIIWKHLCKQYDWSHNAELVKEQRTHAKEYNTNSMV